MSRPNRAALRDSKTRVLVADDEHLVATDIAMSLEDAGFAVIGPATNGAAAVDIARRRQPDVCLMDIRMPEMDGLTAAGQIRSELNIPVVILSAYSDDEKLATAGTAGVGGFLVKPASGPQLRAAIRTALARHKEVAEKRERIERLERQLESRKVVEKAKWVLVGERGMTEPDAHFFLQKLARDKRQKVEEVAAEIAAQATAVGAVGTAGTVVAS